MVRFDAQCRSERTGIWLESDDLTGPTSRRGLSSRARS
jgi:hypothetical protein